MKASQVPPLQVSPLIKLSRWTCLIAGIYHGIVKHKEYSIAAEQFRAEEEKLKSVKKEQLAREEALRNQETARDLAEALTGLKVKFEKMLNSENDSPSGKESISTNQSVPKDDSITESKGNLNAELKDNLNAETKDYLNVESKDNLNAESKDNFNTESKDNSNVESKNNFNEESNNFRFSQEPVTKNKTTSSDDLLTGHDNVKK